jgi:hypothetical protein
LTTFIDHRQNSCQLLAVDGQSYPAATNFQLTLYSPAGEPEKRTWTTCENRPLDDNVSTFAKKVLNDTCPTERPGQIG